LFRGGSPQLERTNLQKANKELENAKEDRKENRKK